MKNLFLTSLTILSVIITPACKKAFPDVVQDANTIGNIIEGGSLRMENLTTNLCLKTNTSELYHVLTQDTSISNVLATHPTWIKHKGLIDRWSNDFKIVFVGQPTPEYLEFRVESSGPDEDTRISSRTNRFHLRQ